MTPALLALALAAGDPPAAQPKPVAATRAEEKELLEAHKKATPRLPMPPAVEDGPFSKVNNGRFRQFYLPKEFLFGGLGGREKDPAETVDPTFKVKLFWVTSRANNCYYCLGHQEHKLLAAGVSDDGIAALDSDWSGFTPAERAALAFTKTLTYRPHELTANDVAELTRHYTPAQALEIIVAVAGFNSMNRWTDGLNIPGEENGDFFKKGGTADLSTFKTPTSARYADARSLVAALPADATKACAPSWPDRPALEPRAVVEEKLQAARARTPALPLAEVPADWTAPKPAPNWVRLLATFPKAGKQRADGVMAVAEKGSLSPRLRAAVAWAAAREDRAWYALAVARDRLKAVGMTDDQIFALDTGAADLPPAERQAVAFARKLAVSSALVTDADVAALRGPFTDKQVAELTHLVCTAALFDRLTEAAKLPLDR